MNVKQRLSEIARLASQLNGSIDAARNYLAALQDENDRTFDITKVMPQLGCTSAELITRALLIAGLFEALDDSDGSEITPASFLDSAESSLQALSSAFGRINEHFDNAASQHSGLDSFDFENMAVTCGDGQIIEIEPPFIDVREKVEDVLLSYHSLSGCLGVRGAKSFQSATKSLTELVEKLTADAIKGRKIRNQLDSEKKINTDVSAYLANEQSEISRLKDQVANDRKTIAEYAAESAEKLITVKSVHDGAASLKASIEAYGEEFDQFQKALDVRTKSFKSGKDKLEQLISRTAEQEATVRENIAKSEAMLSSATVAGLAGHFERLRADIAGELRAARGVFYFGIFLLIVSMLPLAILVLQPILSIVFPELQGVGVPTSVTGVDSQWQYLAQLLGRIALLIPAAWFVSFAARRHASLFKLREHYAYKYSMAVSVEGFKLQAPEFASEVAAAVFEQLAFNPAEKMDAKAQDGDSPAPVLNHILKRLRRSEEG